MRQEYQEQERSQRAGEKRKKYDANIGKNGLWETNGKSVIRVDMQSLQGAIMVKVHCVPNPTQYTPIQSHSHKERNYRR